MTLIQFFKFAVKTHKWVATTTILGQHPFGSSSLHLRIDNAVPVTTNYPIH